MPHLRSRSVKRDRDRLSCQLSRLCLGFRTNPLRGLPESIPDTLTFCSRVTGKPEVIPGQKSASRRSPLISSNSVFGSCHVCFRVGDHSKELFHYTSTAEALENLPRIALQKPREEWPSWFPHIALVMGSSLTKLAFPGSPDPSFRSLQLRQCGFALASSRASLGWNRGFRTSARPPICPSLKRRSAWTPLHARSLGLLPRNAGFLQSDGEAGQQRKSQDGGCLQPQS
jgi:hypothetical protein